MIVQQQLSNKLVEVFDFVKHCHDGYAEYGVSDTDEGVVRIRLHGSNGRSLLSSVREIIGEMPLNVKYESDWNGVDLNIFWEAASVIQDQHVDDECQICGEEVEEKGDDICEACYFDFWKD